MSEAPAELWVRPRMVRDRDEPVHPGPGWYQTLLHDEPDAVRYVRADLYDKRMAEYVNQEPLGELGKALMNKAPLTFEEVNAELNRVWEGLGKLARSDEPVIAAAASLAQALFERELDALIAKSKTLRRVARFPAPEADYPR